MQPDAKADCQQASQAGQAVSGVQFYQQPQSVGYRQMVLATVPYPPHAYIPYTRESGIWAIRLSISLMFNDIFKVMN